MTVLCQSSEINTLTGINSMSFHGYWFNKFKQQYLTYKYPHCYVGIKQKLGGLPWWGIYSKKYAKDPWWGDYSGGSIVNHVIRAGDCTRSQLDTYWDVYVENTWHVIEPGSIRTGIGRMCDASFNELFPDDAALTLFYKAVVPAYAFNSLVQIDSLTYNGTQRDTSTLLHGGVIGAPGVQGAGGNSKRYGALSVSKSLIASDHAYDLPSDAMLNRTGTPMTDFPDGNNILDYQLNVSHYFDDGQGVQRQYNVREVDGNVNFNRAYEFLAINANSGSNTKMVNFAYDVVPSDTNKASFLSYHVNHHLETFNIPSNDGSLFNPQCIYMLPELFEPFMMVLPNDKDITDLGTMALYCVFGVKSII